ncbi:MFS transporter [Sulfolobus sp. S-194]|uniref:MFS transporter n=1 Tax=Sulfolobus sp. S-194 TaxID=2512240 RepID=UPI001437054C|nr:MFS transporter [Sulfolobus sp. S-194]QIW23949.1 MFS transporter [Sulfolobus sp. S-194]
MNKGLVSGTLAFFSGFSAIALFGITILKVGPMLKLNLIESSWLVAIPLVTGAFLRIPFSLLVNKLGKWVLFIQLFIGLIGLVGIIFTLIDIRTLPNAYNLLLLFGAIAGTGISTFSSGITYVSYFYPKRKQGTALGIFAGLGNTAPGIFTIILPLALAKLGLIYSYIAWALFLGLMIILFVILSPCPPYLKYLKKIKSEDRIKELLNIEGLDIIPLSSPKESIKESTKNLRVWALVLMYWTSFGGFEALTEWLPTYWKEFMHIPTIESGILTGVLYSLLTALIRVLGGWWSDIYSGERVTVISFLTMIIGSLTFVLAYSFLIGP